jgi:hypothetical protein
LEILSVRWRAESSSEIALVKWMAFSWASLSVTELERQSETAMAKLWE